MAYYKKSKTPEQIKDERIQKMHEAKVKRWDNSSLGAQIGGLIHDAVAIVVMEIQKAPLTLEQWRGEKMVENVESDIKFWLDTLYDISEAKKKELTEIQPISHEDALRVNEEYEEKMRKLKIEAERDELNRQAQELADKEIPVLEEPQWTGENQAERQFEEKQRNGK